MNCPKCGLQIEEFRDYSGRLILLDEPAVAPVYVTVEVRGHIEVVETTLARAKHRCIAKRREGTPAAAQAAHG